MGDGALPYYFGGTMTRTTGEVNIACPNQSSKLIISRATTWYSHSMGQQCISTGPSGPIMGFILVSSSHFTKFDLFWVSVSLDGGDALLQSGKGGNPGDFQALLYQKEDLDPAKEHNVVVTNLPSRTDRAGESFTFEPVNLNEELIK
jgi:hypothetical protein